LRREEFKRHKTAKPEFIDTFFLEWEKYRDMLMSQDNSGGKYGAHMSEADQSNLTEEQEEQLKKLKAEAVASTRE
jgi:hypothetical protein